MRGAEMNKGPMGPFGLSLVILKICLTYHPTW